MPTKTPPKPLKNARKTLAHKALRILPKSATPFPRQTKDQKVMKNV